MDTIIKFRADSSEREQFEVAAKKAGQTLSKWARVNLVRAALGAPDVFTAEHSLSRRVEPTTGASCTPQQAHIHKQTAASPLKASTGGMKRIQEIPVPDWKKGPVPERSKFTPVPKGGKK